MKIVSVFNNKGGVGKTTLTFHLAHALGELGKRVLLLDLDPQCNLTIYSLEMETIHNLWAAEDAFIDDFASARAVDEAEFAELTLQPRSVHFLLKPTEDGTAEFDRLPPPCKLNPNVHLLPGRLTLHLFEAKVSERWSGIYQGDPLAIRTATRIRTLAREYAAQEKYDYVIFDTSPSLGALNRDLLSLTDGFIVPCAPDLFSLYGIRNIGSALRLWRQQFESIFHFLSDSKRENFPPRFVEFLGFTIYNAKKYAGSKNNLGIAQAHYNYAQQIPDTIGSYVAEKDRSKIPFSKLSEPIGGKAIMYTHNTLPSMAQKYHRPIWELPALATLDPLDRNTIVGNRAIYEDTGLSYKTFAREFIDRVGALND
jgi:cellulose biosynthesis protein BcsQ